MAIPPDKTRPVKLLAAAHKNIAIIFFMSLAYCKLAGAALVVDILELLAKLTVGVAFHSTAFVADALRSIYVIVSRVMALWSAQVVHRPSTDKYSFGLLRIEIVTVMLSAALLIGLSIAIVIDAVSQFIDLEPMTEPFVIFVTGASCLALNLVSRVLMQPRCPVGSGMGMGRSTSEGPSLGTNRMRNRQVDESGQLGNQTFPSSTISGQNGNDQDMDESKITNRRMGGFLRSLSRVRDYLRSWNAPIITLWNRLLSADPQAVSLRSKTVSLWDSSNALGDICITLAALLVWKVPVASIQYIDPTLAMCIALLSMYFAYRLILAASAILLQATPSTIDTNIIKEAVERIDGVLSAHHVHIFALNESKLICSMHVQVLSRATSGERFMEVMRQIRRILHTYGVHSATIQPEYSLDENDSIPFLKAEQTEGENWQRPLSLGNKSKSF